MNFGVFDIEAENWIRFRVLGFFDGNGYKKYYRIGDFLNAVDKKQYKGWRFYSHNGGKYDDMFLLDEIFRRGWNVKLIERGGRLISIRCTTATSNFEFVDSYALIPVSLKVAGETFNVQHKKSEYGSFEGKMDKYEKKLLKYLENDCMCLYEVLTSFSNSEYVDKMQLTIASQALNTFRTRFCDSTLTRLSLEDEDLFRDEFYSGGRVEVYKGRGNVHTYDVNSLYPSVMLNEMPCGELIRTRIYKKGLIGFYKVRIKSTPDWYVSPLLVKGKKNMFVNGKGEYFLSSDTLNYLVSEFGIKYDVEFGRVFKRKAFLFNEYVNEFYALKLKAKKKNDTMNYLLAKLFLNALYGKLGQTRWRDTVEVYNGTQRQFKTLDERFGLVLVSEESHNKFILPYLASYVTDLARLHHFQLMNIAPDKMFYCDTDSLYTSANYDKLVSEKIGALSYEGTFEGIFLSPKTYALKNSDEEKIKFKGFAQGSFSFKDFEKSLMNGKVMATKSKTRILSFRECLKRKFGIVESQGNFLKLVNMEKSVVSSYDKRIVIPSKRYVFNTKPFQRNEI